jgi:hypothetical protein
MSVVDWLRDVDPAIRWQVFRDLDDATEAEVNAARDAVATQGWGAALLALQGSDGRWDGGTYRPGWVDESKPFFDAWTATHFALQQLREFGLDPAGEDARRAVALVRDNVRWEANRAAYFDGEVEPCINGVALANAAYFGQGGNAIVERLLDGRLGDGGWNCRRHRRPYPHHSSFNTTFNVLDGLREYIELAGGVRREDVLAAERAALELVFQHRLYKSDKTGEVIHKNFTLLSFPPRWHYDLLRGLEYFARAGAPRDSRAQDAIDVLNQRRLDDGRWPVQHKYSGKVFFARETLGRPSRWNTLRALRVLRWWEN